VEKKTFHRTENLSKNLNLKKNSKMTTDNRKTSKSLCLRGLKVEQKIVKCR